MAAYGSEVFVSLIRRAENAFPDREDILADLDDIRYSHQYGGFQDSVHLVLSAKEFLNLLIDDPTLELLPYVLKAYVVAFRATRHKEHLASPLPRRPLPDHTAECSNVRDRIDDLCDKLRGVPQFAESFKLPIAELKGCVVSTLCHQPENQLSEVKEILENFAKSYANPADTLDGHKCLLLGLRGCVYALDIGKALQASSPSSPPPPPPPPPHISKRQIDSPDHVRAESSAEPGSKRRRVEQSARSPLHRTASFSEDPLVHPFPQYCNHDGPCSSTKPECRCKICCQGCGCSASCEKKLPSCGCEGPCREECECIQNNAECIDSRCSCSDCPNNFQEQKPVKLMDLTPRGVASSQDLTAGSFLRVLARDYRMDGRQDMHSGDLYQIAKDASVDVCKEDSALHRIERSSSQLEQNVVVLAYRCKEGPSFIIRTTKDVQAGEQLLLPLDLVRVEHVREENEGVARGVRNVEDHETYPEKSSIDNSLGSSKDSGEESEYEKSDTSDSASDESMMEYECLLESDGEKDVVVVGDHQQTKRRTRSPDTVEKVLHSVIETLPSGKPFSKRTLSLQYATNNLPEPDSEVLHQYLGRLRCCRRTSDTCGYRWIHRAVKCRFPRVEQRAHYALVQRECLTVMGLLKLCNIGRKGLRTWLKSASCCSIRPNTKPSEIIHDKSKCTISTTDQTEAFKKDVTNFEDRSGKTIVTWTPDLDKTLLRLKARSVTMRELEKHLNRNHSTIRFTKSCLECRWSKLKNDKTYGKLSDKQMISMIKAATNPLNSHDLVRMACEEVRDKSEANLKSWIEDYRDGIQYNIDFQSLDTCFDVENGTIHHKAEACKKRRKNLR